MMTDFSNYMSYNFIFVDMLSSMISSINKFQVIIKKQHLGIFYLLDICGFMSSIFTYKKYWVSRLWDSLYKNLKSPCSDYYRVMLKRC